MVGNILNSLSVEYYLFLIIRFAGYPAGYPVIRYPVFEIRYPAGYRIAEKWPDFLDTGYWTRYPFHLYLKIVITYILITLKYKGLFQKEN